MTRYQKNPLIQNALENEESQQMSELVLFNEESKKVHALDAVATQIYRIIDCTTIDEIVEKLLDIYEGVTKEELKQDVEEFVDQMLNDQVILIVQ